MNSAQYFFEDRRSRKAREREALLGNSLPHFGSQERQKTWARAGLGMSYGKLLLARRIKRSLIIAALLLIASDRCLFAATLTVRSTADAGGTCPGADCTLRQAIVAAASGDTIAFSLPANSAITLTSAQLLISKDLTVRGLGANLLTVQRSTALGTLAFRIFHIDGNFNVSISGLTIANGIGTNVNGTAEGGAILNTGGTVRIEECAISGNSAEVGGGISNYSGSMTLTHSTVSNNSAVLGGGIIVSGEQMTVSDSTISGNSTTNFGTGAGIYVEGNLVLTNSTISVNSSAGAGGGVYVATFNPPIVTARNTIIALNSAPNGSPDFNGELTSLGYNVIGNTTDVTITGTETGNQYNIDPKLGPLQDNDGPTLTHALLADSPAIDKGNSADSATDQRGFVRVVDSPTIANASGGDGSDIGAFEVQPDALPGCNLVNTIVNNSNDSGAGSLRDVMASVCGGSKITFASDVLGAINLTSAELVINKGLTINGPGANLLSVQRSSAAGTTEFRIFNITGPYSVVISGLTIANGKISGPGGAILNNQGGALTIADSAITGNSTLGVLNSGGGIQNAGTSPGTLTVINSTLSGNSVSSGGGGAISGGTTTIINSTISGNSAPNGAGVTAGTISFVNSTVTGNTATGNGGGVFNNGFDGATVSARNTIIALNTAGDSPDIYGAFTSEGFNLIGNASGATITPPQFSDQIGVSAAQLNLGPLQDNGGPTLTHALLSGSFAIDKGESSGSTTDQRGYSRPVDEAGIPDAAGGDGSDIGAVEVQPPATLGNISTRLRVQGGDNVLIGGMIATGTADKKVIIRAIGPTLLDFGLPDALQNPTLELFKGDTLVASNDDWRNSDQEGEIASSGLAPGKDAEAAIIATLTPNQNYTAIVRGKDGATGIGVVEVYDLDPAAASKLGNISTRGFVDLDDNVMIAGVIVSPPGGSSTEILVRALGPTLTDFGVPGILADPTLDLVNENGVVTRSNDNWKDGQRDEIEATGLAPGHDEEAALIHTAAPGAYTAIVRGSGRTTGVALVEVYALD